ncbi:unnamed protein product, partial [Ascophyllum nodosum]
PHRLPLPLQTNSTCQSLSAQGSGSVKLVASGTASAWSTGKSAIGGRAGNPSAPAPGAFLFSAPSASGLNQNPGAPLFQSPGPATGGFIFGTGGESVGNSAGFGGPSARSHFGRPPPVPRPSRNPSGLFGAT